MNRLTPNFTLSELTHSDYAVRHNILNQPSEYVIRNLKTLANGLEEVRALLKQPINISSGYRGTQLNRAIGGASTSAHLLGLAADFTSRRFGTPMEVVKAIKDSNIEYDQLIYEGGAGGWVHISFDVRQRQQTLIATFKNGKATYKEWA